MMEFCYLINEDYWLEGAEDLYRNKFIRDNIVDYAARNGELNTLKWLYYEKGSPVNTKIFKLAAMNGHYDIVEWCIEMGLEFINDENMMKYALQGGNIKMVELFYNADFELNNNSMKYAAESGNIELVKWLLEKGYNIDIEIIDHAAKSGSTELIKWLLENGSGRITSTTLDNAAKSGSIELVKWILDNKTHLKCDYDTINSAVQSGDVDMVKFLIGKNKRLLWDIELKRAILSGNVEMIRFLISKGLEFKTGHCCFAAESGRLDILKFFLVEEKFDYINDLYLKARDMGHFHIIDWLIEAGFSN